MELIPRNFFAPSGRCIRLAAEEVFTISSIPPRIYLDNAATSWPKPKQVIDAVTDFLVRVGAAAGRGGYREALESTRLVETARQRLRQFLQVPSDGHVVFGYSGTDVINMCLHGFIRPGMHIITTAVDHNSVLRPLKTLEQRLGVSVSVVPSDDCGRVDPSDIQRLISPTTRLLAITHASNVTGAIQPIEALAQIAKNHGVRIFVDVAQTAGHIPIRMRDWGIDFLAGSGHKGLLGPLGTGFACFAGEVATELVSFRQGGTGTSSDSPEMPETMPEKFEPGNINAPGIAGLSAGLDYINQQQGHLREHEKILCQHIIEGLRAIPKVRVLGPESPGDRTNVVPFVVEDLDCHEVAQLLEMTHGIQVRAGIQCAPYVHHAIGASSGTVRASVGPFNTIQEVEVLLIAIQQLATLSKGPSAR